MSTVCKGEGGGTAMTVRGGMGMRSFGEFFRAATGEAPYPYQGAVAGAGLPPVLQAPTGAGKTAAITMAWLWRRHGHPDGAVRASTPRRLVLALPMRVLVDQTEASVRAWVSSAGLEDVVDVHVVMGARHVSEHEWRRDAHRSSILVGTADMVVSKLLVRAYGASRNTYPMDFALLGNGSHVVLDEVQLMPEAAATLRQVAAFAQRWPTAEPFGVTLMSATVDPRVLDTVDNPWSAADRALQITDADRTGSLRQRLEATRVVTELDVAPGDARGLAAQVVANHVGGTRTLVVVNTVRVAVDLAAFVRRLKPAATVILVHSRFRPVERAEITERLLAAVDGEGPGAIVIATQVVEAGVDLDSTTLITQAAPWPSVVQRAGRCNRVGDMSGARILWVAPKQPEPYRADDVAAAVEALRVLQGTEVTSEELLRREVVTADPDRSVLRAPDFLGLFDTAPDLSGGDVDVSPYIRSGDDLDVHVAWEDFGEGAPTLDALPPARAQCPVPLGALREWLGKGNRVWTLDAVSGGWRRVSVPNRDLRPGLVLVADAQQGGYTVEGGFSPKSTVPVPLVGGDEGADLLDAQMEGATAEPGATAQPEWMTVREHSDDAAAHARSLLGALDDPLAPSSAEAVVTAALLHDVGKAAKPWGDALLALAEESIREGLTDPPYAKSAAGSGRLRVAGRPGFRHELVSALILSQHAAVPVPFLVRYLVAAHHGRIRVQGRDATATSRGTLFGLHEGEELELYPVPALLAGLGESDTVTVDLAELSLGGESSWTRSALRLLEEHGPFVLAYLELLVRVADWRSSGGSPRAERAL
jgi:CRISPR-associated endonuclease/helicase Cas3